MTSPLLFNVYTDGVEKERKAKAGVAGVKLCVNGDLWVLNAILLPDDTVLIA